MKLNIISTRTFKYPNQTEFQRRYFEICSGNVSVDVNTEIGNAIPMNVWDGRVIRINIPHSFSRGDICRFFQKNKELFQTIISGNILVDIPNLVHAKLTNEGMDALDNLEWQLYNA
jgi:hypothetical protein